MFRDVVAGYVHYFRNGSIAPVVINKVGIGQYDVSIDGSRIEAEGFQTCTPWAWKKGRGWAGSSGRFVVSELGHRSMLEFPHVRGLATAQNLLS